MARLKTGHFILTGSIDSGKTSKLLVLVESAKAHRISVSGVLLRSVFSNDPQSVKCGYDLLIIDGNEISACMPAFRDKHQDGWQKFRKWHFNPEAFKAVNNFNFSRPFDLFVIDEIGPLELEENSGFSKLFETIYPNTESTITVVRDSHVKAFCERLRKIGRRAGILDEIDSIIS